MNMHSKRLWCNIHKFGNHDNTTCKNQISCNFCKGTGHTDADCFLKHPCSHCGRKGHKEEKCLILAKNDPKQTGCVSNKEEIADGAIVFVKKTQPHVNEKIDIMSNKNENGGKNKEKEQSSSFVHQPYNNPINIAINSESNKKNNYEKNKVDVEINLNRLVCILKKMDSNDQTIVVEALDQEILQRIVVNQFL